MLRRELLERFADDWLLRPPCDALREDCLPREEREDPEPDDVAREREERDFALDFDDEPVDLPEDFLEDFELLRWVGMMIPLSQ